MPFELPPLPYDYAALEPHIDEQTMRIHHDKHHQAYVDNANKALDGTQWAERSAEAVITELEILPEEIRTAVRNNAGGHANHSLFWEIMSPDGGGEPEGALAEAIADVFGSVDTLKEQVNDAGVKRFGSGWTWLVWDGTGLAVVSTPNQDSPLMDGDTPLLGIDVWEHAYYLKYQNRRPDYLGAWWNVVNWPEVARRYEAASGGYRDQQGEGEFPLPPLSSRRECGEPLELALPGRTTSCREHGSSTAGRASSTSSTAARARRQSSRCGTRSRRARRAKRLRSSSDRTQPTQAGRRSPVSSATRFWRSRSRPARRRAETSDEGGFLANLPHPSFRTSGLFPNSEYQPTIRTHCDKCPVARVVRIGERGWKNSEFCWRMIIP